MDMNLAFNESDSDNDEENPSDAGMDYRLVPMVAVNSILNLAVVINAIVCFIKHVRCLHPRKGTSHIYQCRNRNGQQKRPDDLLYVYFSQTFKFEDRKKWVHRFVKPFRKFSILVETHRDIDCITEENHELLDIDYITEEHHELLYIKQMNISRIIGTTVVVYAVYILYLPRMLCKQCRLQVTPETALPLFICITQLQDIQRDISVTSLLIS